MKRTAPTITRLRAPRGCVIALAALDGTPLTLRRVELWHFDDEHSTLFGYGDAAPGAQTLRHADDAASVVALRDYFDTLARELRAAVLR